MSTIGMVFDAFFKWYAEQPWWIRLLYYPRMRSIRLARERMNKRAEEHVMRVVEAHAKRHTNGVMHP